MGNERGEAWPGEQVVAASMEPTALLDSERYIRVNHSYAALLDSGDPARFSGRNWRRWVAEDDHEQFEDVAIPACRTNGSWQGQITGCRSDASPILLDVSLAAVGEDQFVCSARRAGSASRSDPEGPRRVELVEHLFDAIDDIVYVLHDGGETYYWNDTLLETTGYSHEEVEAMTAIDFLPEDHHKYAPGLIEAIDAIEDRRVEVDVLTKDGERIPHEFKGTTFTDGRTGESFRFGIARDITERRERERRLERQRDELKTLDRINGLILELISELFQSPTRSHIEQTVCDSLAASGLYGFAWIGSHDASDGSLRPRVTAGIDENYVASTLIESGANAEEDPAHRAYRTGEMTVSQSLAGDPAFAAWRGAASDHGARSAAAVPLVYGDTIYGVLGVYSERPLAFSQREQDGFESLGTVVGVAINAIKNRKLLFADSVVELEFEVTDRSMVFVHASEELACEFDITGFVESESGQWSLFVTVENAPPSEVRRIVRDNPTVADARVLAAEGENGLLELVLSGRALNELTEHGAMLTAGHVADGRGRFCVEAPQSVDIRQLTDRLRATYPDSVLVAQREFDRPVQTATELRQSVDEYLTDRQWSALKRSYLAGYFDWPRTSTAEDVAEMMDVSETTFHYHLRHGLDSLLATLADLEHR